MDHSYLGKVLREFSIDVTEEKLNALDTYYEMLVEKNKVMNLTGITEYDEVVLKHFIDSAAIAIVAGKYGEIDDMLHGGSLIDIGTGAGFPGLVIAILYPDCRVTLLDSLNKRIGFLNEVVGALKLKNVTTIHARSEEVARKAEFREQFDLVVSRAVARTATLAEFDMAFVRKGGYFLPYKSSSAEDEIREGEYAIKVLGGELIATEAFRLTSDSDIVRMIPVIKKIKNTDKKYPRVGKKAETKPLLEGVR